MIIDNKSYTGDGSTRQFNTSVYIASNSHIAVFIDNILQPTSSYDLLGSVVLFNTAPSNGVTINFVVSDTGEDLPTAPNEFNIVSNYINEIVNVSDNIEEIIKVDEYIQTNKDSAETIASLKLINKAKDNQSIELLGYYSACDGGGGTFYWDATSTETDNGGTIIQATGVTTGRWKRVFSGAINVKWFGANGDGVTDDTVSIQNALYHSSVVSLENFEYIITSPLYISSGSTILGNGASIKKTTNTAGVGSNTFGGNTISYAVDSIFIITFDDNKYSSVNLEGINMVSTEQSVYAIYAPYISNSNFSDINITNVKHGYYSRDSWMTKFSELNIACGDVYNPLSIIAGSIAVYVESQGTSLSFTNCWSRVCEIGYYLYNVSYVSFVACGCDHFSTVGYQLDYCTGSMNGVGLESSNPSSKTAFRFLGSSFSISGAVCYISNVNRIFHVYDSKIQVNVSKIVNSTDNLGTLAYVDYSSSLYLNNNSISSNFAITYDLKIGCSIHEINKTSEYIITNPVGSVITETVFDTNSNKTFGNNIILKQGKQILSSRSGTTQAMVYKDASSDNVILNNANTSGVYLANENTARVYVTNYHFRPVSNNAIGLGHASALWTVVYASSATINTSDERLKTFYEITENESSVAKELKNRMRKFKYNDAIAEKGEELARFHFGVSAQEVVSIFAKHGLDAMLYGIVCYDKWDEQEEQFTEDSEIKIQEYRPAGDQYGIRYEELLCFIIAHL